MEDIDTGKICSVITFLEVNEQYDKADWLPEIAELYKVLDAIEGVVKQLFNQGGLYIRLFFYVFNCVGYMQCCDSQRNNKHGIVIYCCRKEREKGIDNDSGSSLYLGLGRLHGSPF